MHRTNSWPTGFLLSLLVVLPAGSALAQVAQEDGRYLEEIIVTATKRTMSQQEAPIAITTITSQDIANTFGNDPRLIAELTPNVTLTNQTGFNAIAGGIRGTGSLSILTTQDPSTGIMVDEFVLNHVQAQFVELYDIEQIEVYRGPQGTLFGKNSTGGVIAITSKRPDLEEFGADVEVTYGQYDRDGSTSDITKFSAGIDIPIIEGVLGFRFAGMYDANEGYYKNNKPAGTAIVEAFPADVPGLLLPAQFPDEVPLYSLFGVNGLLPPELDSNAQGANEQLNDKEVFAGKAKLLWTPNDFYTGLFTYERVRDNSDSPPGVNETPTAENFLLEQLGFPGIGVSGRGNDPYVTGSTQQGNGVNLRDGHKVDVDGFYITQDFNFEKFSIRSISGYRYQEETLGSTYTGEAFLSLFDASRNLERDQYQQEIRVVTNFDGPFNFVAGGSYLQDDLDFRAIATIGFQSLLAPCMFDPPLGPCLDSRGFLDLDMDFINDPTVTSAEQNRKSWAGYIDGTYEITDRLNLSAGIRYTQDDKDFQKLQNGGGACNQYTKEKDAVLIDPDLPFSEANCASDNRSTALSRAGITGAQYDPRKNPLPPENFGLQIDDDEQWTKTTWRVALDYGVTENQRAYFTVATGFLSGGFSETCSTTFTCDPYDEETNTNYEIGYKADWLDGTLRTNLAVFYTEFEDLQRNQVVPFTQASGAQGQETITVNAGESTAQGFELEATWLPLGNMRVKGFVGYLDAEYDDFAWDPTPNEPPFDKTDFSDLDIPFAPEWQVGLDVTYDQDLGNGGVVVYNVNGNYQDEAETSPFDPNAAENDIVRHPTNTQIEERTLINAAITYRDPTDRWHVTLYGRNLTDQQKRVTANSVAALWNFTQFSDPRQYGIQVGMSLK